MSAHPATTTGRINPTISTDIVDISQKRKNIKSTITKPDDTIYSKNILWKKKIVDRSMEMKKRKDEIELKQCSFSPKTSFSGNAKLNDEFYENNIKWKKEIEKTNQNKRVSLHYCSFIKNVSDMKNAFSNQIMINLLQ